MIIVTWAVRLLLFAILSYVVVVTYNVYIGPLSKIPGPTIAKATRLVLVHNKLNGQTESWILNLHKIYGDVVQVAPNEVSFATGKALRELYGHAPGSKFVKHRKDPQFYQMGPGPADRVNLLLANDTTHVRQRKIFSHAFSDRALKQQEPLLREYTNHLISNLDKIAAAKEKTDIVRDYGFVAFDIMGDLAFGESLGCLKKSDYTPWVSMIFSAIKAMTYLTELTRLPIAVKLAVWLVPRSVVKKAGSHVRYAIDRVDKRLEKQDAMRPDIWGFVLAAKEDEKLLVPEMHANSHLFMLAGTETIATTMSGLTFYLMENPEVMEKLTTQIRESAQSAEELSIDIVTKLPYLDACIKEALRIYPPVASGLPRIIAKGGVTIDGHYLPEGTVAYVHQYATHRNPRNFHSPDSFIPDRWLDTTTSNPSSPFASDDRSAVQPFSLGPRNCLGINLANLEMKLILASVLYNFDLTLCDESRDWRDKQKVFTLWEKGRLMVTVQRAGASVVSGS